MTDPLAAHVLAAHDSGTAIPRLTDHDPAFDLAAAYRLSSATTAMRIARGERPIGWKIGYTNRSVQKTFGVHAPIWGRMYDTSVQTLSPGETGEAVVAQFSEPRVEPEIVLRIARPPEPGMSPAELMACVDGVGHSLEIVHSIFRGWSGTAADSVASGGLHGRLFHGPLVTVTDGEARAEWVEALPRLEVAIRRDGIEVDRGRGSNALDGPLSALGHFVDGLHQTMGERLKPGEIVTTGTLTKASLVHAGETWSTEMSGVPLAGLKIRFR